MIRQLGEEVVGVRWPPAYEDMSPEAKDRPPLQGVTKQSSKEGEWEQ
jgi:hypothetical protein